MTFALPRSCTCFFLATLQVAVSAFAADWKPAQGPLLTRWAKDVSPDNALPEYPRPQLVREQWQNLNGLWDYAIRPREAHQPEEFDGEILVPYPIESALSGVMKPVGADNRLWFRRSFTAPKLPENGRLLLHFGAVDWHATVWVNGTQVGEHKGGFDPITLDITDTLFSRKSPTEELVVSVWDPSDKSFQPRGKQVTNPGGIFYTSVTGIWQTVWLEVVPTTRIESLTITPDVDRGVVHVTANTVAAAKSDLNGLRVSVEATSGDQRAVACGKPNDAIELQLKNARLWSPDDPHLYDLRVRLVSDVADSASVDEVTSYFGMRKIEVKQDADGFNRLFLNNQPLFQFGPLDQGWWPDGLYTAPTDEALRYDVEITRQLGFNMCRKHVKVEPERWYYHCDQLGLLVWQDMPSGDRSIGSNDPDFQRSAESEANYRREWQAIINARRNHPSIVVWVPFNEGWGQFKTSEILAWTKELDPTRLVDGPSGWADRGTGDMNDMHHYPGPGMPEPEPKRAVVLGEFGGLGLPMSGHLWWDKRNWGYRTYTTQEELRTNYKRLMKALHPLVGKGLAAAVYTQTTDVEGEVNGLLTYDRDVVKIGVEFAAETNRKLYEPPPVFLVKTLLPTSERQARTWRYSLDQPKDGWEQPDFDDSAWRAAPAGFGEKTTPGSVVRTDWKTSGIWIRQNFTLESADAANPCLRIHHDEDAEVYVNGRLVAKLDGYSTSYEEIEFAEGARQVLKQGKNTLAVHCRQTGGGQYIDVGIVDVVERR